MKTIRRSAKALGTMKLWACIPLVIIGAAMYTGSASEAAMQQDHRLLKTWPNGDRECACGHLDNGSGRADHCEWWDAYYAAAEKEWGERKR
jgi:hypothetical protein